MKLRLRNLETKETLRLQIPSPFTLQQLQQTLSQSISLPQSSSLYFSLNRNHALHASSLHDSLTSLGITSGDLIYFSLNPTSFSNSNSNSNSQESKFQESENSEIAKQETPITAESDSNTQMGENQEIEDTQDLSGAQTMDIDIDDGSIDVAGKRFSEPYFLRRVLRDELGDDGSPHKLLVIAVHAVLLESGFVGFDSVTGLRVDSFHVPDERSSTGFAVKLWYTLPELLLGHDVNESVVLKFQSVGRFVNVYGCLSKSGTSLYRVCLDQNRFAPIIDSVWVNCEQIDKMDDKDGSLNSYPENEVFEFWKIVKDGLALPLLIDICDNTGLALPACLMWLPTELKVKILELLPPVDVAKMGCVCTEMRYLSSNNDLWKQKFVDEFGDGTGAQGMIHWKERFANSWESRKKRKRVINRWRGFHRDRPFYLPIRRDPVPFGSPLTMIGGDYDRLPGLGIPSPFGQRGRLFPRRRDFLPPCNLGGFHS